jgi:hypothetical protein
MEFEPLLPGDETDLASRVAALAAWCQGFLYGFGSAGTASQAALSESVGEVLADLAQVARGAWGESPSRNAYANRQFLRAAVPLVWKLRAAPGPARFQSGH